MDISKGYLRLFRQMLDWEWYDNPNVKVIFIHCLLCANTKEKKWRDIILKRGQFITSYEKLAASNGLTNQQTRTALKQLQLTHEIEYQSTNQYTVITVKNFNLYQADNTGKFKADTPPNNKRKGGQVTTTNNTNSNTSYINSSSSSSIEEKISKLTEEEEEILKNISKRNGVKYFRRWLKKVIENNDHISLIAEERRKQAKKEEQEKEKKKEQKLGQGIKPDEVDSEIVKQWREKARKRL